jgi:DNA-binding NtrC family response regulator
MVFGIVKQHRGWIDCESVVHEGTTFDFYLPRHAGQEAGAARAAPAPPRAAPAGQETVLLVDDEPMIRQLGSLILERHGYVVLLAGDGLEALEVYRRHRGKIDLVILDLTMPRLSGQDTFKRLLELDPGVRVLFSSGYSAEHVTTAECSQVLGFLNKPYRAEEMAAKLRDSLDRARGRPRPDRPAGEG